MICTECEVNFWISRAHCCLSDAGHSIRTRCTSSFAAIEEAAYQIQVNYAVFNKIIKALLKHFCGSQSIQPICILKKKSCIMLLNFYKFRILHFTKVPVELPVFLESMGFDDICFLAKF